MNLYYFVHVPTYNLFVSKFDVRFKNQWICPVKPRPRAVPSLTKREFFKLLNPEYKKKIGSHD